MLAESGGPDRYVSLRLVELHNYEPDSARRCDLRVGGTHRDLIGKRRICVCGAGAGHAVRSTVIGLSRRELGCSSWIGATRT